MKLKTITTMSVILLMTSILSNNVLSDTIKGNKNPISSDSKVKVQDIINTDKIYYGQFTIINGEITVIRNGIKIKPSLNFITQTNDKILSGKNSKAEITFKDGSKLRLDKETEITISATSATKDKYSFLKMLKGQVWAKVINKGVGRFAIKSNKAVFAVMGTSFAVKAIDTNTEMSVYEGSVGVTSNTDDSKVKEQINELHLEVDDNKKSENPDFKNVHQIEKPIARIVGPKQVSLEEWVEITQNQKITVSNNGEAVVSNLDNKSEDSWTKWNKGLDSKK